MMTQLFTKPSPAGRPKDMAKRAAILEAARQHFLENGFVRTSLDAIAKDAQVSKLTIYSHFENKEELFRQFIVDMCNNLIGNVDLEDLKKLSPNDALCKFARYYTEILLKDEALDLYRIMVIESKEMPDMSEFFYQTGPKPLRAALCELLQHYHDTKQLKIPDSSAAAENLIAMLRGEWHCKVILNVSGVDRDSLLPRAIDSVQVFLRAYSA